MRATRGSCALAYGPNVQLVDSMGTSGGAWFVAPTDWHRWDA